MAQEFKQWSKDLRYIFKPSRSKTVSLFKVGVLLVWGWFFLSLVGIVIGR